jgi:hypothetical protein
MTLRQDFSTPNTLDSLLQRIDNKLGRLGINNQIDAFGIFSELDAVQDRIDQAKTQGINIKAELAQFDGIGALIKKEASSLIALAGGEESLKRKRATVNPSREHWWWYLDEYLAEKRRSRLKRIGRLAVISVGILVVLILIYRTFLAPDPKVIAELSAQQNAEVALSENNLELALAEVDKGLAEVPDSLELQSMKAGILEAQGKTEDANRLFESVRTSIQNDETFYLMKAQVYQRMGRAPEVIQLLEGVLQQYPDSAKGYLIIGQAYEDVGDQLKALDAYEKASVAGEKLDDSTTVAQARIKMGMLLQILALPSIDNETVTPTP